MSAALTFDDDRTYHVYVLPPLLHHVELSATVFTVSGPVGDEASSHTHCARSPRHRTAALRLRRA